MGSAAFFEPEQETVPESGGDCFTIIFDIFLTINSFRKKLSLLEFALLPLFTGGAAKKPGTGSFIKIFILIFVELMLIMFISEKNKIKIIKNT